MPDGLVVYRFGAFEFDPESRRLSSRAQSRDVTLSVPQAAILAHLLSHPAAVIAKDALFEAGWRGLVVTDNTFLTFVQGRTRLETLDREGVRAVRHAFAAALRQTPGYARGCFPNN